MRLIFAGTPEAAVPSLRTLAASRHRIEAVVTRPDAKSGRGRRVRESAVARAAKELGLPVLKPPTARDPEFLAQLAGIGPDGAAAVAYGALLPPAALAIPAHGWVNLHFSLLPAWRGAAPVQRAILAGETMTGATAFRIEEALDSGPVFGVMTYQIPHGATSGEVLDTLARTADSLLLATFDAIEDGSARPRPQPEDGISLAPRLEVADARIDWTEPAWAIDRRIRACTPAPGAWTTFRGERLGLGALAPPDKDVSAHDAGALVPAKRSVHVGTGTSAISLGLVRPAGRAWMEAAAWARGARPDAGETLGGEA